MAWIEERVPLWAQDLEMHLYWFSGSPPCRSVILFIHTLNLMPDMIEVSFDTNEQMTPEFRVLNPQHAVPFLVDDGFILTESRAILGYLADKYAPDTSYYPDDPRERAVVHQRLFFDIGALFQAVSDTYFMPYFMGQTSENKVSYKKMLEALNTLNVLMGNTTYTAGNKITIADFTILSTISTMDALGVDIKPFPKVYAWFERCKIEIKNYEEINGKGAALLARNLRKKVFV